MTTSIAAALTGLLLLSNAGFADAIDRPWTKASAEEPTYKTLSVAMTGYNALPGQTDDDPDVTASGTRPIPGVTAARSRDLAEDLPFGTVIEVVPTEAATSSNSCGLAVMGDVAGYRVITDLMHERKRQQIDLVFDTHRTVNLGGREINRATVFGICPDVEIRIVGKVDINNLPQSQMELRHAIGAAPSLAFGK